MSRENWVGFLIMHLNVYVCYMCTCMHTHIGGTRIHYKWVWCYICNIPKDIQLRLLVVQLNPSTFNEHRIYLCIWWKLLIYELRSIIWIITNTMFDKRNLFLQCSLVIVIWILLLFPVNRFLFFSNKIGFIYGLVI